ncbi:MAG: hypothetical protein AAGI17_10265 [Planctomycetota bacterium]
MSGVATRNPLTTASDTGRTDRVAVLAWKVEPSAAARVAGDRDPGDGTFLVRVVLRDDRVLSAYTRWGGESSWTSIEAPRAHVDFDPSRRFVHVTIDGLVTATLRAGDDAVVPVYARCHELESSDIAGGRSEFISAPEDADRPVASHDAA